MILLTPTHEIQTLAVQPKATTPLAPIERAFSRPLRSRGRPACVVYRPIRIGFVVGTLQAAHDATLVRTVIHQLNKLIEPTIYCLEGNGSIVQVSQSSGARIEHLSCQGHCDPSAALRLAATVRDKRIQILHAHGSVSILHAAIAKARLLNRVRLVSSDSGPSSRHVISPLRHALNRLVLQRFADAIIACDQTAADNLVRIEGYSGRRVDVIGNNSNDPHQVSDHYLALYRRLLGRGVAL